MSDEISKSKVVYLLDRLIRKQENIRDRIDQKLEEIQKHHRNCNIARTVGGSLAVVGTIVGFVGAFFTCGLSLIIGGLVAFAAGNTISMGTNITDKIKSKYFINDVKKMVKEQDDLAEKLRFELKAQLKSGYQVLKPLQKQVDAKVDRHQASAKRVLAKLREAVKLTYDVAKVTGVTSSVNVSAKIDEMIKSRGKVGRYIARGIKFFGPVVEFVDKVLKIAMPVLGAIGIVTGIVNNWTTAHPTEMRIRQQRDNLEQSIKNLKSFLEELQNIQN